MNPVQVLVPVQQICEVRDRKNGELGENLKVNVAEVPFDGNKQVRNSNGKSKSEESFMLAEFARVQAARTSGNDLKSLVLLKKFQYILGIEGKFKKYDFLKSWFLYY